MPEQQVRLDLLVAEQILDWLEDKCLPNERDRANAAWVLRRAIETRVRGRVSSLTPAQGARLPDPEHLPNCQCLECRIMAIGVASLWDER